MRSATALSEASDDTDLLLAEIGALEAPNKAPAEAPDEAADKAPAKAVRKRPRAPTAGSINEEVRPRRSQREGRPTARARRS